MKTAGKSVTGALALAAILAGSALASPAAEKAGPSMVGHSYNLLGERVGVAGYDPVSYFLEGGGRPRKGLIAISLEHDGVTYRFTSQEHLALFKKDPKKYLPAYGGWCAWAVGELGKRVDVDPESFEIRDGKLYLFYRDPGLDTRSLWLKGTADLITKANANWPSLRK